MIRSLSLSVVIWLGVCSSDGAVLASRTVANWNISSYSTDAAPDVFDHCGAFQNAPTAGVTLHAALYKDDTWALGVANPQWNIATSTDFPIILTFDKGDPVQVAGVPTGPQVIFWPMPVVKSVLGQFLRSKTTTIALGGQVFKFDTGTARHMFPAMIQCLRHYVSAPEKDENPFAKAAPPPQ